MRPSGEYKYRVVEITCTASLSNTHALAIDSNHRDSYVAVAGLPEARRDHAEVMARFAHKCLLKMNALVHKLETTLGPGTSELKMRVGLHR